MCLHAFLVWYIYTFDWTVSKQQFDLIIVNRIVVSTENNAIWSWIYKPIHINCESDLNHGLNHCDSTNNTKL